MRLFFLDPALTGNIGHHANQCRYLSDAARAKGIQTNVYAHREIDPNLAEELGAIPHFRFYTYNYTDGDPICGWLNGFLSALEMTRQDFLAIEGITREDVVFIHSAQPAQLMAAIEWICRLEPEKRPGVIIEIGGEPGLDIMRNDDGEEFVRVRDPSDDPRGILFRFVAQRLHFVSGAPFHVLTVDSTTTELFRHLTEQPIGIFPFPVSAIIPLRRRGDKLMITISVLGHQQPEKGYLLMPEIVEAVLRKRNNVRFAIHNSDPTQRVTWNSHEMREAHGKLQAIAALDARVILHEQAVDLEGWKQLLTEADVVLCPYSYKKYAVSHSGVTAAAISNGIPLVVPSESPLGRWVESFEHGAKTFHEFNVASVVDAIEQLVDDFDNQAKKALVGAAAWAKTQGIGNFLEVILELKNEPSNFPQPTRPRVMQQGGRH